MVPVAAWSMVGSMGAHPANLTATVRYAPVGVYHGDNMRF